MVMSIAVFQKSLSEQLTQGDTRDCLLVSNNIAMPFPHCKDPKLDFGLMHKRSVHADIVQ